MGFSISPCLIRFLSLSFLLTVLLFPQSTPAEAIALECTLGFNGVFRLKKWTPLTVVMENSHRGIQGQLEVVVTSGSEYQNDVYHTTYSSDVDLPTHSKKTYTFTILIDSYVHPLIIRLKKEKEIILSQSINLRQHYTTKPLLIFAGDNLEDPSPLLAQEVQPVYTPVRFLPETWYGYQGIKGLILKAGGWKDLQPRQYAGITQWIKAGGYVITAGSLYETSLSLERLEHLMSFRVVGLERVREISALRTFCGTPLVHRDPFLLLKVTAPRAETVLRDENLSLILEKGIGLGKILFFAFDVTDSPFRNWPGRGAFWEKILQRGPAEEMTPVDLEEGKICAYLLSKMPARFPFFFLVFPFLLGYLFLVTFLMKRIADQRKQVLKTLSLLTLAVLLSALLGCGLSFFPQIKNKISFNGLLHMKITGPQALAQWKYYLGVYSQKEGDFRLPLGPDDWLVTGLPTENPDPEKFHSYTFHESGEVHSLLFPLYRWSHRFFSLTGFGEFPLQAKTSFQEQDLVLAIDNRSPFPIKNCNIYFGGQLYPFGNIAPGKKQVKRLALKARFRPDPFTAEKIESILKAGLGNEPGSFRKEMEIELNKELWISIHERNQGKRDRVFLIGWIDSLLFPANKKNKAPFRDGASLLEWEIPLET
jgi:hypothetical protein